jgi:hypothetical protein
VCTGTGYVTIGYGVSSNYVFTALVKAVTTGSYTLTASEASSTIQQYVGSLTGNVTANGTLQFNQSAANTLTISNLISGTGTLSLTNTGTLNLTGTSGAANTVVLDMTTSASLGLLQIRSGGRNTSGR